MKVATHNAGFHADDVFAISILRLIYPDLEVIRTRDPEKLKDVDMRIDVGGVFDPTTGDFDHHQRSFDKKRKNGIPYASAGLIWNYFGDKLVSSQEVKDYLDETVIQFVDANDTGVDVFSVNTIPPYTIADFVKHWNPVREERSESLFDACFEEIVPIIMKLLQKEIKRAEEEIAARIIIRQKIKESDKEYIVLENPVSWRETVIKESDLKFVILYDGVEGHWVAMAVPLAVGTFENRKDFPKAWGGLYNENLQSISGVEDAIFCHSNLFIAIAKSKEGIIKLVEKALEE